FSLVRSKDGCQIAADCPSPGADIGLYDFSPGFMAQKFLQKLQRRSVIKYLRTNLSPAAPWGSNDQRDPIPEPDRPLPRLSRGFSLQILLPGYILPRRIDTFGGQTGARIIRMRRREWRNMIKVSVIFVIGQNKNGLFPDFRVARQYVHCFGDVPCAIPRRARMIGKVLRRDQPGDRRQTAVFYILPKLMEDVPLRDFQFSKRLALPVP